MDAALPTVVDGTVRNFDGVFCHDLEICICFCCIPEFVFITFSAF